MSPTSGSRSDRRDPRAFSPGRRSFLAGAAAVAGWAAAASAVEPPPGTLEIGRPVPSSGSGVRPPGLRHSMVNWCYAKHFASPEAMCDAARRLGIASIELCPPEIWPTVKRHGLDVAIASSHGFAKGFCRTEHHAFCLAKLEEVMTQASAAGVPQVITFTGFNVDPEAKSGPLTMPVDRETGVANCVAGLKEAARLAEKHGVKVSLEMLNTRDPETMKGHPGYFGDSIDLCYEIVQAVGSPQVGLLFDLYHVQIMHGDLIRRVGECADRIFHVHTAGVPGRNEIDDAQEINYRPVIAALAKAGYGGYLGHEFIPTRDAEAGLAEAVRACTVPA